MEKFITINHVEYYYKRIYLEYEQPELFLVSNSIGEEYVVMLVDEEFPTWLMTAVSAARLCEMEYGNISIKEVFTYPELGCVSRITKQEDYFVATNLMPKDIDPIELPSDNARLNWENIPMPTVSKTVTELATERGKDIFDVRIISDETKNHTIQAKKLGSLLVSISDVVSSFAKEYNKKQGIKRGLTAGCGLRCVQSYAGSFGIRFESEGYSDLADETKLTPVLEYLFGMLNKSTLEEIPNMVKESSFYYTQAFRKLLKYSKDNCASLIFSFSTPHATKQEEASWSNEFAVKALDYLDNLLISEEKEEEYIGDLISVSKKNQKFGFVTETEEEVNGAIDSTLKEHVFKVTCRARIKIRKTIRINNANETEEKCTLVGIQEIE